MILLLLPALSTAEGEPSIKHFFPHKPVLLGQPAFWVIEIRHPLWETYELRINPLEGTQIETIERKITKQEEEIRETFRLRIVPQALVIRGIPSVVIRDEKGESTVLNGKPLIVHSISGDSVEIKDPSPLLPRIRSPRTGLLWYLTLLVLSGLLAFQFLKRRRSRNPRRLLLRDLKRALSEVQKARLPLQVWRLLRSDLLWGFSAEAWTPSQLKEKGASDPRLLLVADTLQALEGWRYAGPSASWERERLEKSLCAAMEIVDSRRKK